MSGQHLYCGKVSSSVGQLPPGVHLAFERETSLFELAGQLFVEGKLGVPTLYTCEIEVDDCQLVFLPSQRRSTARPSRRWQTRFNQMLESGPLGRAFPLTDRALNDQVAAQLSELRATYGRKNLSGYIYINEVEGGVCMCYWKRQR